MFRRVTKADHRREDMYRTSSCLQMHHRFDLHLATTCFPIANSVGNPGDIFWERWEYFGSDGSILGTIEFLGWEFLGISQGRNLIGKDDWEDGNLDGIEGKYVGMRREFQGKDEGRKANVIPFKEMKGKGRGWEIITES